jgi:hypothetical protein
VFGEASTGVGMYCSSVCGISLATSGRVRLSKVSGIATIGAGRKTVTVTPGVDVSSGSFVLLTPRANVGSRAVWFTVDPAANTFTIRMSGTRTSGTPVAWLLLS